MPELPEVEIARRNLLRWLEGRKVVAAQGVPSRIFRGAELEAFAQLKGPVTQLQRRGKYLLFTFGKTQGLVAHLGMTGKFLRRKEGETVPHSRAHFVLDNKEVIHFRDPRLFGQLMPVPAGDLDSVPVTAALGPDALETPLSPAELAAALGKTTQDLKVALMDQARIAGLGNIHAAEALHRAHLHPARKPASLSPEEWKRLAKGIKDAIVFALKNQEGDEIQYVEEPGAGNVFHVYGHEGEACPRCGTAIESFKQAGRTTFFCPTCQEAKGKNA